MRLSQKCNLSHGAPRQLYGIEMYAKWPSTPCQRQACAQADTRANSEIASLNTDSPKITLKYLPKNSMDPDA